MNFGIASFRAFEKGVGSRNQYPLQLMLHSGGRGIIRPMNDNDDKATSIMLKSNHSLLEKPFEPISGSLNSFLPVTLELVSGSPLDPNQVQLKLQWS